MRLQILIIAALSLSVSACTLARPDEIALSDAAPKLVVRSNTLFRYNPDRCQLGFNSRNVCFRMMTDDMSEYVTVTLDHIPSAEGEKVPASELSWTTGNDFESRKNITLEVLKLEGGVMWLWYQREAIALVLEILE